MCKARTSPTMRVSERSPGSQPALLLLGADTASQEPPQPRVRVLPWPQAGQQLRTWHFQPPGLRGITEMPPSLQQAALRHCCCPGWLVVGDVQGQSSVKSSGFTGRRGNQSPEQEPLATGGQTGRAGEQGRRSLNSRLCLPGWPVPAGLSSERR